MRFGVVLLRCERFSTNERMNDAVWVGWSKGSRFYLSSTAGIARRIASDAAYLSVFLSVCRHLYPKRCFFFLFFQHAVRVIVESLLCQHHDPLLGAEGGKGSPGCGSWDGWVGGAP